MKSRISIDFTENWDVMEPIIRINLVDSSDPKDKMLKKLIDPKQDYLELVSQNENEYFLRKATDWVKLRLRIEDIYNSYKENSEYDLSKLGYGMCSEYFYFNWFVGNETGFAPNYLYTKDLIGLNLLQLVDIITKAINKELDGILLPSKLKINDNSTLKAASKGWGGGFGNPQML